jgi:diphthine-ammonia ligase
MKKHVFKGVCSGAILSNYQKNRVENVCNRLNLVSFAPLWKRNQEELLLEMIQYGIDAIIIKTASSAIGKECLGMRLDQIMQYLKNKNLKYEMNYCGEGGEYESLTLDCKYYTKPILYDSYEIIGYPQENNREDWVYYLKLKNVSTIKKSCDFYGKDL